MGKPKFLYVQQNGDFLEGFEQKNCMMHMLCICFYKSMFAQIVTNLGFVEFLRSKSGHFRLLWTSRRDC